MGGRDITAYISRLKKIEREPIASIRDNESKQVNLKKKV